MRYRASFRLCTSSQVVIIVLRKPYILKVVHWINSVEYEKYNSSKNQEQIEKIGDTFEELVVPWHFDSFFCNIVAKLIQFSFASFF